MSAFFVLPSAAATCTPLRESATSMLVCASLNLMPPATALTTAALRPNRPATAAPPPPALFSENTTAGVRMKSAATICPPPMFEPCAQLAAGGERALLHHVPHAGPRSTTMKQFDCWIIMRIRPTGDAVVARERYQHLVLRLDHGHCAHRRVAVFQPVVAFRSVGACRALDDAAALALLGFSNFLRAGRCGEQRDTGQRDGGPVNRGHMHWRPPAAAELKQPFVSPLICVCQRKSLRAGNMSPSPSNHA